MKVKNNLIPIIPADDPLDLNEDAMEGLTQSGKE